jgi:hypothetical protein
VQKAPKVGLAVSPAAVTMPDKHWTRRFLPSDRASSAPRVSKVRKTFYRTSENAVKTQIWIAVSVHVLVRIPENGW